MQVEIYGPDDKVHYRRPVDDRDVLEALRTQGYYVLCPRCQIEKRLYPGRLHAAGKDGSLGLRCDSCEFGWPGN